MFGRDDNPSFEDWLKEKEGNSPYKDLEDAIGKTVDSMYDGITSDDFGSVKPDYDTWLKMTGRD